MVARLRGAVLVNGLRDVFPVARRRRLGNLLFRRYQPRPRLGESLGAADFHFISLRSEVERWIVPSKLYGIAAAGRPTLFIGAAGGGQHRFLTPRLPCEQG